MILEYQPQGTTNTGQELLTFDFQLEPNQTRVFASLKEAIPDLEGEELEDEELEKLLIDPDVLVDGQLLPLSKRDRSFDQYRQDYLRRKAGKWPVRVGSNQ